MRKIYFNWKLVKLIKDLIGYVESDKIQVKLMNKLQGAVAETQEMSPYFKMVHATVNAFNAQCTFRTYGTPHIRIMWYCEPACVGAYGTLTCGVRLLFGDRTISRVHKQFYHFDEVDKYEAIEIVFKQLFDVITLHGLTNLIQMYSHGFNYTYDGEYNRYLNYQRGLISTAEYEKFLAISNRQIKIHEETCDLIDKN